MAKGSYNCVLPLYTIIYTANGSRTTTNKSSARDRRAGSRDRHAHVYAVERAYRTRPLPGMRPLDPALCCEQCALPRRAQTHAHDVFHPASRDSLFACRIVCLVFLAPAGEIIRGPGARRILLSLIPFRLVGDGRLLGGRFFKRQSVNDSLLSRDRRATYSRPETAEMSSSSAPVSGGGGGGAASQQRRIRFGRSLSERWRRSATGETVERIWMKLRQATLQGI